jgi:rubrerythrin/sarcosine oxidase gamma subunit
MAQLVVLMAGLLLLAESQASDMADRSTLQAFLSKYVPSGSDASQNSMSDYDKFISPNFNNVKQGNGPDALSYHNTAAKNDAFTIVDAAKGDTSISTKEQSAQKLLANNSSTSIPLFAIGIGLLSLATMIGARLWRGLQPDTTLASSGGLGADMPMNRMWAPCDNNVMEMRAQDSRSPHKVVSGRVGWGKQSSQSAQPRTLCYAGEKEMAALAQAKSGSLGKAIGFRKLAGKLAAGRQPLPPPAEGPALFSWPYILGAAFVGYRTYKKVIKIKKKQKQLIEEFGGKLILGKKQRKAQFAATKKLYARKLMFLPRGKALFASGLKAITAKKVSLESFKAFRDLCDAFGVTNPDVVAAAVEAGISDTSSRGKALFYASRHRGGGETGIHGQGLASPKLEELAAEGLDGSMEFLKATQANYAEMAYVNSLGKTTPYTANAKAAAALGLDDAEVQRILDGLNAEPDPDDGKEEWQKELEARVVEESGALPDASEVDMTDKFAAPSGTRKENQEMLRCECQECAYSVTILADRAGKFFSDAYKCPECGAPKSKFNVEEAPSA